MSWAEPAATSRGDGGTHSDKGSLAHVIGERNITTAVREQIEARRQRAVKRNIRIDDHQRRRIEQNKQAALAKKAIIQNIPG